MTDLLFGKVAIVTGAAGGLGGVFAEALARAGADVALVDVQEEGLTPVADSVRALGRRALALKGDVREPEHVRQTVSRVVDELGGVDILVSNAGGSLHTPKALGDIEPEHWDLVLDVNLKGTFLFCQAVVPVMRERGGGRIINISSIGGRMASVVTGVPYASAKAGVIGLTRRLAREVGEWGITVNALAPGAVLSGPRLEALWAELSEGEQQGVLDDVPLGRLGTAEEQADMLVCLAGPASRYVTGAVIDVNGGRYMG